MKGFGRFLTWVWIVFILAFAGVCVYGAFLGPQRAGEIFNSKPFSLIWVAMAAAIVLICIFLAVARKTNWLAKFVIHFGILLVLVGGIANSRCVWMMQDGAGKDIQNRKIPLTFTPGPQEREIPGAKLRIENTAIEYYPMDSLAAWKFYYRQTEGKNDKWKLLDIPSDRPVLENIKIPGSDIEITKLTRFCEGMRDRPAIVIPTPDGVLAVDANIGDDIYIAGKPARVTRFYENLAVRQKDGQAELVELIDGGLNPAVELSCNGENIFLLSPGMTVKNKYRMSDGNMYMYLPTLNDRSGKVPPLVTMIDFKRGKFKMSGITAARENQDEMLLGLNGLYPGWEQWKLDGSPTLVVRLQQPVKMMAVLLAATLDNGEARNYAVSPNMPAKVGDYYVYLESINTLTNEVTMLAVRDRGWPAVFWGFCIVFLGVCWLLWDNIRKKEKTE